ncbi:MAG: gliding motility lipoprotein GldD [Bacteroidota bacterium]|nr:gliding motility lipoprotein GldD [Bacteroidota bacterium]
MKNRDLFLLLFGFFFGCKELPVPKPKIYLNLNYPEAVYEKLDTGYPFKFDKNKLAITQSINSNDEGITLVNLNYSLLNAKIYLTHYSTKDEMSKYISEFEFGLQNHAKVAHEISEQKFKNAEASVFGNYYEITGPTASQSQFYVTDSIRQFLTAALYFEVKPNYDSILPAVRYIQKDMVRMLESLEWKN